MSRQLQAAINRLHEYGGELEFQRNQANQAEESARVEYEYAEKQDDAVNKKYYTILRMKAQFEANSLMSLLVDLRDARNTVKDAQKARETASDVAFEPTVKLVIKEVLEVLRNVSQEREKIEFFWNRELVEIERRMSRDPLAPEPASHTCPAGTPHLVCVMRQYGMPEDSHFYRSTANVDRLVHELRQRLLPQENSLSEAGMENDSSGHIDSSIGSSFPALTPSHPSSMIVDVQVGELSLTGEVTGV